MATLTGKIMDVTQHVPESISSVVVKAPTARIGGGGIVTSSPADVSFDRSTGEITITGIENGLSWLFIQGDGWTDSIALAVAEGFTTILEAALNALAETDFFKNLLKGTAEINDATVLALVMRTADSATRRELESSFAKLEHTHTAEDITDLAAFIGSQIASLTDTGGPVEAYARQVIDAYSVDSGVKWYRGSLTSEDLDSVTTPGFYTTATAKNATAERHYPLVARGTLLVTDLGGGILSQLYVSSYNPAIYQRERFSGAWGSWRKLDSRPTGLGSQDLDTITDAGLYYQANSARATEAAHYPALLRGTLQVVEISRVITQQIYISSYDPAVWVRERYDTTWREWTKIGGGAESADGQLISEGAARRDFLISDLLDRKGGTIGTGGKAAVAFRFDHHTGPFLDKIMPIMEANRMPWAQALNSRTQGDGNNTMSWADLQDLALRTGGEVHNHGATHLDASTLEALADEIVTGLAELRTALPLLPIDGWMQPGTSGTYGGLQPGRGTDNWTTTAGRLILAHHPVAFNYKHGTMSRLSGTPKIGQAHLTLDGQTADNILPEIDRAIAMRAGVVLMIHPSNIDAEGGMPLADFTRIVEYVASKRESGDLVVLTPTGIQVADAGHDYRRPLLSMEVSEGAKSSQRLATRGTVAADGVHEIAGTIEATGQATINVVTADRALDVTWTANPGKVHLPFTIPVGAADISVSVTGATGGSLTVHAL